MLSSILSDEIEHFIDWTDEDLINYDRMKRSREDENYLVMNTKSLSSTLKNNFKKVSAV